MEIGAIFLILTGMLLVAIYVIYPFMQKPGKILLEDHTISSLLAENDRILNALQELDFDNTLGKIPEEDYPFMRKELLNKGVDILKQLDELRQTTADTDVEKMLEDAITARKLASENQLVSLVEEDEEIEALIAKRRLSRDSKSAGFCSKCGNPILLSDVFCPRCGNSTK
ncbi:MAG TPA: zinc ribbon domain-containing protein [Anaerolineales bacterium]|nr:zinc ribbon domain-containing protein [Anaerolineales bacterium]